MIGFHGKLVRSGRDLALMETELAANITDADNARKLRCIADIFERWVAQLRFKADVLDGNRVTRIRGWWDN